MLFSDVPKLLEKYRKDRPMIRGRCVACFSLSIGEDGLIDLEAWLEPPKTQSKKELMLLILEKKPYLSITADSMTIEKFMDVVNGKEDPYWRYNDE